MGQWGSEASSVLQLFPIARITAPPVRSAAAADSHRSWNATGNSKCEGSGLCTPYENLMPDDLILHYGELLNYFIIYHNITKIKIKCIVNVMCLNHPQTIPLHHLHGNIVFHETYPSAKKHGDCCPSRHAGMICQKAGQGILAPDSQAEGCLSKTGHTHDLSRGSGRTGGLAPGWCRD